MEEGRMGGREGERDLPRVSSVPTRTHWLRAVIGTQVLGASSAAF